ncbi:uncharacterized protein LOC111024127 [Momordica charantia]|uniref:Uncharacterized protein LOC111024127 n=1 Tax=Momordica charantia TaxID=3673 RepID=A0A6J1DY17_MOMCH|nr:uncharacterized protein LOC111024127 [Momordica charantia]
MEIKSHRFLKWPERMKAPPGKRSKGRYCLKHRDHGNATQDCFDLKEEVEGLMRIGYLKEYVEDPKATQNSENDCKTPAREIRTIMGGPVERESVKPQARIEFSEDQVTHLLHPHNDALVIILKIAHAKVHRILVDGGSSADIIFLAAYKAMSLGDKGLKSSPTLLVRFGGERVIPEGRIKLPVTFRSGPKSITKMVYFLVVDYASSYNGILGRPTMHMLRAIPST